RGTLIAEGGVTIRTLPGAAGIFSAGGAGGASPAGAAAGAPLLQPQELQPISQPQLLWWKMPPRRLKRLGPHSLQSLSRKLMWPCVAQVLHVLQVGWAHVLHVSHEL